MVLFVSTVANREKTRPSSRRLIIWCCLRSQLSEASHLLETIAFCRIRQRCAVALMEYRLTSVPHSPLTKSASLSSAWPEGWMEMKRRRKVSCCECVCLRLLSGSRFRLGHRIRARRVHLPPPVSGRLLRIGCCCERCCAVMCFRRMRHVDGNCLVVVHHRVGAESRHSKPICAQGGPPTPMMTDYCTDVTDTDPAIFFSVCEGRSLIPPGVPPP